MTTRLSWAFQDQVNQLTTLLLNPLMKALVTSAWAAIGACH